MANNSGPPTKKKRQGRRSTNQIEFLVDYMLQNPNLATGKFLKMNSRDALQGLWEDLVKELNGMRTNGQAEKNIKSWKESWRDQKTKTSKKVGALRSARAQTGNNKNDLPQLSDLDKKVLSIIRNDYVEGTSCPDSWPEEQENNVQRMASGDPDIYLVEPTPLTFEIDEENIDQENIEYETISCDFVGDENIDESVTLDVSTTPSEGQGQQIRKPANVRDSRLGSKSLKTPRMVKQKLTSQLQAARNSFNTIAENQADAMTLMADSLSVIENDQKMLSLYDKILERL